MLNKLVRKLTEALVSNQYISSEEREQYVYAMESMVESMITLSSIIMIAIVANAYSKSFNFSWNSKSAEANTYCSQEGHQLKTVINATQKHPQSKDVKSETYTRVLNGSFKNCSLRATPYQGYSFTSANGKGYIDGSRV